LRKQEKKGTIVKEKTKGKEKMKPIKFYFVLWLAKMARVALKIIRRDATYFPGKLAVTLCPDFLGYIEKPRTIIGVTGTNGKTTVCNMISDILTDNGYDIMNNMLGANINAGVASALIVNSTFMGKAKKQLGVLELDERSAVKIYPYVTPTYLVCTNLFRDSIKRNAHTEFIADILTSYIPKETELLLNGDDLITSNLAPENKRKYFSIGQLETDTKECRNIVRDITVCPKCKAKLEYTYVRYNHIGKAHCTKCDFASPEPEYVVSKIDNETAQMELQVKDGKTETYHLVSNNIINIYNELAAITAVKQIGLTPEQIEKSLQKLKIVETRFQKETVNGTNIILQLAKGMNPIACSRAFDFVRREPGRKAVILLLDDLHDAQNSSENSTWIYDTDYEFLNEESIEQVIVAGARYMDSKVRLEIAGVPPEKIVAMRRELEVVEAVKADVDSIFVLHDLYAIALANEVKEKLEEKLKGKKPV